MNDIFCERCNHPTTSAPSNLNESQKLEETLHSAEHDARICTQCGHAFTITRFLAGPYEACPECQYHSARRIRHIAAEPTVWTEGLEIVETDCLNCHYHKEGQKRLPPSPFPASRGGSSVRRASEPPLIGFAHNHRS